MNEIQRPKNHDAAHSPERAGMPQLRELAPTDLVGLEQVVDLVVRKWPRTIPVDELMSARESFNDLIFTKMAIGQRVFLFEQAVPDSKAVLLGYGMCTAQDALSNQVLSEMLAANSEGSPEAAHTIYQTYIEQHARRHRSGKSEISLDLSWSTPSPFEFRRYFEYSQPRFLPRENPPNPMAFLMVEVASEAAGFGHASRISQMMLEKFKAEGHHFAFGFPRLPGLSRMYSDPEVALEALPAYCMDRSGADMLHPDKEVRFHQRAGGKIVSFIPYCSSDAESLHHAAMCIYDLRG